MLQSNKFYVFFKFFGIFFGMFFVIYLVLLFVRKLGEKFGKYDNEEIAKIDTTNDKNDNNINQS